MNTPSRHPLARAFVRVLLAMVVAPVAAAGQSSVAPLAPGHWSYEFLDVLQALGAPEAWSGWIAPLPGGSVLQMIHGSEEALQDLGATGAAGAWSAALQAELGRRRDGHVPAGLLRAEGGFEDGAAGILEARGWNGALGGEWRPTPYAAAWGRAGISESAGSVEFLEGGLGLTWRSMYFLAGRYPVAMGQGRTPTLAGGRVAMDGFLAGTRRPARLPWLLRYLGPVSFQTFLAPSVDNAEGFSSWFGTMALAVSPHPRIQLGLMRSARFAGDGIASWDWSDFWDMLIGNSEFNDFDDSQGELDLRIRVPLFGLEVTGYGVLGFEDKASIKEDPALVAGVLLPLAFSGGVLTTRYEFTATGRRAMWCGSCDYSSHRWYDHHKYGLYSMNGAFYGSELGGYGGGHSLQVTFWSGWADRMPLRISVRGFHESREEENRLLDLWPGTRRGLDAEIVLRPRSAWEVSGKVVLSSVEDRDQGRFTLNVKILDILGFPGY